jgi:biopolymer transport protein ExbB/TolQ
MHAGALLKTFIYVISSSLLYPVLFFLVVLCLVMVLFSGMFFAEWLDRVRTKRVTVDEFPTLSLSEETTQRFPYYARRYFKRLLDLIRQTGEPEPLHVENLLQEENLNLLKMVDRLKIIVRVGPSLGLMGTLIPMGTGLAAIGQGDMTRLSSDLVIAFTTTVVGLAIGIIAFVFYTVKRRWAQEDIKDMEILTEMILARQEKKS